jgi:hypothetical protein
LTLSCERNEYGVKSVVCSKTNQTISLTCNGVKGSRSYTCGTETKSLCSFWTGKCCV